MFLDQLFLSICCSIAEKSSPKSILDYDKYIILTISQNYLECFLISSYASLTFVSVVNDAVGLLAIESSKSFTFSYPLIPANFSLLIKSFISLAINKINYYYELFIKANEIAVFHVFDTSNCLNQDSENINSPKNLKIA